MPLHCILSPPLLFTFLTPAQLESPELLCWCSSLVGCYRMSVASWVLVVVLVVPTFVLAIDRTPTLITIPLHPYDFGSDVLKEIFREVILH
jgi:hypothetical protein